MATHHSCKKPHCCKHMTIMHRSNQAMVCQPGHLQQSIQKELLWSGRMAMHIQAIISLTQHRSSQTSHLLSRHSQVLCCRPKHPGRLQTPMMLMFLRKVIQHQLQLTMLLSAAVLCSLRDTLCHIPPCHHPPTYSKSAIQTGLVSHRLQVNSHTPCRTCLLQSNQVKTVRPLAWLSQFLLPVRQHLHQPQKAASFHQEQ